MPNQPPASRWLKSTEWLAGQIAKPDVAIVDASYYLPTQKRDPKAEYIAAHIPGAVFFDINAIADASTDLPHMLPGPDQFAAAAGKLGIAETDTIVVYDGTGLYSAPRVWWTFRIFGAKNVFILDGGLPAWKAEGRPLEAGDVKRPARSFKAAMDTGAVAMVGDVEIALTGGDVQVIDARSAGRFAGREAEPRAGLALRPHAGRAQCALRRYLGQRAARRTRQDRAGLRQGRRRFGQTDDHHLRFRRHRRDAGARARRARQAAAAHL